MFFPRLGYSSLHRYEFLHLPDRVDCRGEINSVCPIRANRRARLVVFYHFYE